MYRCVQLLAVALAVLATGCCLPRLGGRNDEPCAACDGQSRGDALADAKDGAFKQGWEAGGIHDRRRIALHGRHYRPRRWPWSHPHAPGTPPGELVPLPRFHPVPVRPVFEPQFDYAPPQLLMPYPPPLEVAAPADSEPTPAAESASAPTDAEAS